MYYTLLDYIFEEEVSCFDMFTMMETLSEKINTCREMGVKYVLASDEEGNIVLTKENVIGVIECED